jgi:hypothetical protein
MVTKATSNRRLLKLADFLTALPRKRFDYGVWVGHDWKGAADLSCGTTACALGWAATMPEFRRLGLVLNPESGVFEGPIVNRKHDASGPTDAAMVTFGLDYDEATYVFHPESPPPYRLPHLPRGPEIDATPKQVATHIRRFVKNRE